MNRFSIGFPPFLGGPFRYMDTIGAGEVAAILQRLAVEGTRAGRSPAGQPHRDVGGNDCSQGKECEDKQ